VRDGRGGPRVRRGVISACSVRKVRACWTGSSVSMRSAGDGGLLRASRPAGYGSGTVVGRAAPGPRDSSGGGRLRFLFGQGEQLSRRWIHCCCVGGLGGELGSAAVAGARRFAEAFWRSAAGASGRGVRSCSVGVWAPLAVAFAARRHGAAPLLLAGEAQMLGQRSPPMAGSACAGLPQGVALQRFAEQRSAASRCAAVLSRRSLSASTPGPGPLGSSDC